MRREEPEAPEVAVSMSSSRSGGAVHPLEPSQSPATAAAERYSAAHAASFKPFRSWFPWIVPAMVVANVTMFVVTMYVNNCPRNSSNCSPRFLGRFSFQPFKENPLLGPSSLTLEKMGALDVNKVVHGHQQWRLISCIWLHGGVFHILANMLGLLFIGIRLEREFGFVRIGLLYIISGIGGTLLSALFNQSSISVGASGALFGLLGGMLSELITNWTIYENKFAALGTLIFIIIVNLAIGILPHVDNFAHIGGFISGFLLGFVFLIRPHYGWVSQKRIPLSFRKGSDRRKHRAYQYILLIVASILLIIGFIVGFIILMRGVNANDHCSWCHYLSCVPTSKWSCKQTSVSCEVTTSQSLLNLTCQDNGRSHSYSQPFATESQIRSLCEQLCR